MRSQQDTFGQKRLFVSKQSLENALLPRALLLVSEELRLKNEKLFDIAYMIAKLELPFTTFPSLCALEKKNMEFV